MDYSTLSTEALQERLNALIDMGGGVSDEQLVEIEQLASELDKRCTPLHDQHEALERFMAGGRSGRTHAPVRAVLLAAVLTTLLLGTLVVASAHTDAFVKLAHWTQDIFSFQSNTAASGSSDVPYIWTDDCAQDASFQEVLDSLSITEIHAPEWLPEGYQFDSYSLNGNEDTVFLSVVYLNADKMIHILISTQNMDDTYEKESENADAYRNDGTTYYVVENTNNTSIVWTTPNFEISIIGEIKKDEALSLAENMNGG